MQHNSGKLKQTNKSHKGIVTSKRAVKRALGPGKTANNKSKKNGSINSDVSGSVSTSNRLNRINRGQQIKKTKRNNIFLQKRIGSSHGPPKIVAIIPLSESVSPHDLLAACLNEGEVTSTNVGSSSNAFYSQFKAHVTYITTELDVMSVLDVTKVADIVLLLVDASSDELISDLGATCLSAMKAQGCPDILCCIQGLDEFSGKALFDRRKTIGRIFETEVFSSVKVLECSVGNNDKMNELSRNSSVSNICRQICAISPKDIGWRSIRTYLLGQTYEMVEDEDMNKETETVRLGGYLRGRPLPLNSLVHIVGVGTGRIKSVVIGKGRDPSVALEANQEKQESLLIEATADGLSGEQTWPSEAEMNLGGEDGADVVDSDIGRNRRITPKNIPAGMSSYQADWFVDDEGLGDFDEDGEDGEIENNKQLDKEDITKGGSVDIDDDNDSMMDGSVGGASMINTEQSSAAALIEKRRLRTLAQAKDDKEFPDELDTPADVTARLRFARYRALQSFRSSPWHPKENLPTDYARIYQFENFGSAQRRILAEGKMLDGRQSLAVLTQSGSQVKSSATSLASIGEGSEMALDGDEEGDNTSIPSAFTGATDRTNVNSAPCLVPGTDDVITSGQYVTMDIEFTLPHTDGISTIKKIKDSKILILFSLLKHENKLSVMHCQVQRNEADKTIIKSKEELYFQIGFRTFAARPVFSEANLNCDKHKFERFWLTDRFSVASIYAPITFHPSPVLVFKRAPLPAPSPEEILMGIEQQYKMVLIGTGSLGGVDPDRIILKKVILTGHPIRVRKKFAVVKHMFYDPMDVRWFKPAEMVTKHGLRGHIKEPVGTHGLLKGVFSAPIKQNDTVMLILYKRVYPKLPLQISPNDPINTGAYKRLIVT